ncbi:hypothetical protein Tco_1327562 [Tanacetum coccineum]
MEAPPLTVDGHHRSTHRRSQSGLWYPGRMYVSGRVDIFDMVDIDLFAVVALNMMVLKLGYTGNFEPMYYNYLRPLTSLDEGLYALACEEDVHCLATLVRSFKATLEEITDEPDSIVANKSEKILLLTWHESSETPKEPVCDSVTPSSLPQHDSSTPCKDSVCESQHDCILTPPTNESVITYIQLSGVQGVDIQSHVLPTIQSQFSDINLSVVSKQATASQVIDDVISSGLSHDESFGVDDFDLNLNKPVNLNVSQIETQSELPIFKEPYVGRTQEPILAKVSTQEPIVAESSKDAGTNDDDNDLDEDFLVDEENEIVKPDVDKERTWMSSMQMFDSDPGNDEEKNYRKRRLAELRAEMESVINASSQWKYSFYTGQKFTTPKEAKDRVYLHSIESRRNLRLYKNDGVRISARSDGKVHVFTMSQGTGPTGLNCRMDAGPSGSTGPTTRISKKRKNTSTNDDSQASSSILDAHDKGDLMTSNNVYLIASFIPLLTNTFSGLDHEDANEHIEKVLEIVDLFHIPNITIDQVMLRAFPMSLNRAASRWLRNKPSGSITT